MYQDAQQLSKKVEDGLIYEYYEGAFDLTEEINRSAVVNSGISSQFSIKESPNENNFAFVFKGYIKIPKDGFILSISNLMMGV